MAKKVEKWEKFGRIVYSNKLKKGNILVHIYLILLKIVWYTISKVQKERVILRDGRRMGIRLITPLSNSSLNNFSPKYHHPLSPISKFPQIQSSPATPVVHGRCGTSGHPRRPRLRSRPLQGSRNSRWCGATSFKPEEIPRSPRFWSLRHTGSTGCGHRTGVPMAATALWPPPPVLGCGGS